MSSLTNSGLNTFLYVIKEGKKKKFDSRERFFFFFEGEGVGCFPFLNSKI